MFFFRIVKEFLVSNIKSEAILIFNTSHFTLFFLMEASALFSWSKLIECSLCCTQCSEMSQWHEVTLLCISWVLSGNLYVFLTSEKVSDTCPVISLPLFLVLKLQLDITLLELFLFSHFFKSSYSLWLYSFLETYLIF